MVGVVQDLGLLLTQLAELRQDLCVGVLAFAVERFLHKLTSRLHLAVIHDRKVGEIVQRDFVHPARQLGENGLSFECFPYIHPEPVLVK